MDKELQLISEIYQKNIQQNTGPRLLDKILPKKAPKTRTLRQGFERRMFQWVPGTRYKEENETIPIYKQVWKTFAKHRKEVIAAEKRKTSPDADLINQAENYHKLFVLEFLRDQGVDRRVLNGIRQNNTKYPNDYLYKEKAGYMMYEALLDHYRQNAIKADYTLPSQLPSFEKKLNKNKSQKEDKKEKDNNKKSRVVSKAASAFIDTLAKN